SINDEVDIRILAYLASLDPTLQNRARDCPSPLGKSKKFFARGWIRLRLGNQAKKGRARNGLGLQSDDCICDLSKVVTNVAGIRVSEFALRDIQIQVHTQRRLRRPRSVYGCLCCPTFRGDSLHRQTRVSVAFENCAGGSQYALARVRSTRASDPFSCG